MSFLKFLATASDNRPEYFIFIFQTACGRLYPLAPRARVPRFMAMGGEPLELRTQAFWLGLISKMGFISQNVEKMR